MKLLKQICLIFLLALASSSFAHIIHEFSIYYGGGISTLLYSKNEGDENFGLGGHFGFGYAFFFSENWGILSGAEMALYNTDRKVKTRMKDSTGIDPEYMHAFEFRSLQNNIEEEATAIVLQIPLMLQFSTGSNHQFYAAAGGKIGVPLKASSKSFIGSMTNSRYYPHENVEYADTHEFLGLGTFKNIESKEDISSKTMFFASAETGMKWKLSESMRFYTGVYFDYGLTAFSEEYGAMAVGAKIKFSFGSDPVAEEERRKAAEKTADSLALAKAREEAPAAIKAAEKRFAAIKAAEDEERRKEAEKEAARLAAIKAAEARDNRRAATELQAEIDAIQNQVLNDFHLQQVEPNEEQKLQLDKIVGLLQKYPQLDFYINGHTCDLGEEVTNYRLGMERAKNTQKYILEKGIDKGRILGIESKLHYEPLVPNTSEENRKKNRRVEFLIENSNRKIETKNVETDEKTEENKKTEDCICHENDEN
jgi:outer membrane protein OmpA-like peptidoglycan-associated protein